MDIKNIDAYVISINSDRLSAFRSQSVIDALPFTIQDYRGIDGRLVALPSWWPSGAGAWGCYRSHLNLIEQSLNADTDAVLIFEDDAQFSDNFLDRFEKALNELPQDWDALYLGCEHLNEHKYPARYISSTLVRPGNANRTHAWMISRRGLPKIYKHLCEYKDWPQRYHIDHRLGQLHERREINVYACLPNLVYQAACVSDLDGKPKDLRTWDGTNWLRDRRIAQNIKLVWAWSGFGSPGLGGQYGYEDKCDERWPRQTLLSVHAPGTVVVDCQTDLTCQPRMGKYLRSNYPVRFFVDGELVCTLQDKDSAAAPIELSAGRHEIEILPTGNGNGAAQTLLLFDDLPLAEDRVIGIEIISNTQCAKSCPGCNQSALMTSRPGYEFTLADAQALIETLKKTETKAKLFISGGEPAMWKSLSKVMKYLRSSDRIDYTQIATSCVDEKTVSRLKKYCDLVCCSIRSDQAEWLEHPPQWLDGCRLWDQRQHVVAGEAVSQVDCACASQGIECCLIGQEVYACTLAASFQTAGKWGEENAGSCTLESWITDMPFAQSGTYQACKICPNNKYYRQAGEQVETAANECVGKQSSF